MMIAPPIEDAGGGCPRELEEEVGLVAEVSDDDDDEPVLGIFAGLWPSLDDDSSLLWSLS